jgi:cob(I)alamin adenosyltransferase
VVEKKAEQEETITISATDFYALQKTLADIRFELANMRRDARQDKLEVDERYEAQQAMLRAILAWLPPISEHLHQCRSDVSSTLTPCRTF